MEYGPLTDFYFLVHWHLSLVMAALQIDGGDPMGLVVVGSGTPLVSRALIALTDIVFEHLHLYSVTKGYYKDNIYIWGLLFLSLQ
jgi:hypothetical protein